MNEMEFENKLRSIANGMDYPRTPDIAGSVTTRLRTTTRSRLNSKALAWSLTIILVLCSSLMLIPPARAAILEFIQIGVVRIFPQPIEPTIEPVRTATTVAQAPITATVESLVPILNRMAGKTTLADAQKKVDFPIVLPTYPDDLGQPDYVYVQNADGQFVILVWLDPQHPDQALMSLHLISNGSWMVKKMQPTAIRETHVGKERAIWTTGPYPIIFSNDDIQYERLINGHVLIWGDLDVTYRLETGLSIEEAVKVAESLEPVP
jgi:hypothetical protein